MKTLILTIGMVVLISLNIKAQQLPNSDFENWTQQIINEPDGFLTSNSMWSVGNVTKVAEPYHGSFAAKLETILSNNGTVPGMLLIGTPGNQTINGGIPYTGTPDSVSGYVKYDVQPNDTAFVIVAFKKNGNIISPPAVSTFTGLQSVYVRFSIPTYLQSSNPPDSMVAIITCSNMDPPQIVGSTLTIDSISFLHSSQPFPNGDFENWTEITSGEDPVSWGTYANQFPFYHLPVLVTKTTDAHLGNFAVKLISDTGTVQPPFGSGLHGDTIIGSLQLNLLNGFSSTKYPFAYRPDSLIGYIKGTVATVADNFNLVWTQFSNNGNNIGQANYISVNSISDYTRFSTPVTYSSGLTPDSLMLTIFAGNPGNYIPGNVFYVDDLSFIYNSVGINSPSGTLSLSKCKIYPNPAKNLIYFDLYDTDKNAILEIIDSKGSIVISKTIYETKNGLDISSLENGLYFYVLNNNGRQATGKFVITK